MTISLAIIGATGKLGRKIITRAKNNPKFTVVQEVTRATPFDTSITPDIIIDVASSTSYKSYLDFALQKNIAVVIGSTGQSAPDFAEIREAAKNIPILLSPNFSEGVARVKEMVAHLPKEDVDIYEAHHTEKKDAPSGTALALKTLLPSAIIHSERIPGEIGTHKISVNTGLELITIEHRALSRDLFAEGALKAASFLYHKPKGLYNRFHD